MVVSLGGLVCLLACVRAYVGASFDCLHSAALAAGHRTAPLCLPASASLACYLSSLPQPDWPVAPFAFLPACFACFFHSPVIARPADLLAPSFPSPCLTRGPPLARPPFPYLPSLSSLRPPASGGAVCTRSSAHRPLDLIHSPRTAHDRWERA